MMGVVLLLLLLVLTYLGLHFARTSGERQIVVSRLERDVPRPPSSPTPTRAYPRRLLFDWMLPLASAATVFCATIFLFDVGMLLSVSFAFVSLMVCWMLLQIRVMARMTKIEEQLLEAVDLMTSGLEAGASAETVLSRVASESSEPLKGELREVVGRLRFGDAPADVFDRLSSRVPLETMKILCLALAVHWGTGGRLVPLLRSISRAIRDRAEISRHARLQSTQSRLSGIGILCAVYLIGIVVWQTNPESFRGFLLSPVGSFLIAFGILLQGIGVVWISRMTAVRY